MEQPRQTSTASQPPETPSQPSEPAPKPAVLSQIQQPPSTNPNPSSAPSIPSSPSPPSPSLNPNPNPPQYARPVTSPATQQQQQHLSPSLGRPPPPSYSRPWQPHSSYAHFSSSASSSSPLLSSSSAPASSSSSSSLPVAGQQRGGMAIGVPASPIPSPSPTPASAFPGSFGQQYGGLGRGTVGMSEASSNSSVTQGRMMQGTQGMGMMGTIGSGSQMRPSGMPQHPQRPAQSSLRPASSPSSPSPVPQNFQGHSLMRPSSIGSPGVQSTGAANQPWLSSSAQGKPPLAPPSYRPQVTTDIHKDRLAAVKKSMTVTEAANARFGHGTANARGGQAKTPAANPLASTTFNH
ncbi:hypothetical protein F2Q69_00032067 [Brassica cretica]|uniref:Uncharacterized protein n=1 Tax=Brassica cretica TaxID=69181 RepID=A0A8S9S1W0_BRACR|nr:hypothetical protein F2Q69_00032067 [Brassica cretica]